MNNCPVVGMAVFDSFSCDCEAIASFLLASADNDSVSGIWPVDGTLVDGGDRCCDAITGPCCCENDVVVTGLLGRRENIDVLLIDDTEDLCSNAGGVLDVRLALVSTNWLLFRNP